MDGRVTELGTGEVSSENVPGVRNAHSSCHSLTELPKQEADQEANENYLLHVHPVHLWRKVNKWTQRIPLKNVHYCMFTFALW